MTNSSSSGLAQQHPRSMAHPVQAQRHLLPCEHILWPLRPAKRELLSNSAAL